MCVSGVYAAISNDTQSINNITIINSISTNNFDYNIFKFILKYFRKNIDIVTKVYCVNTLPVISDCKRLYSRISGEKVPMPLVYL